MPQDQSVRILRTVTATVVGLIAALSAAATGIAAPGQSITVSPARGTSTTSFTITFRGPAQVIRGGPHCDPAFFTWNGVKLVDAKVTLDTQERECVATATAQPPSASLPPGGYLISISINGIPQGTVTAFTIVVTASPSPSVSPSPSQAGPSPSAGSPPPSPSPTPDSASPAPTDSTSDQAVDGLLPTETSTALGGSSDSAAAGASNPKEDGTPWMLAGVGLFAGGAGILFLLTRRRRSGDPDPDPNGDGDATGDLSIWE
jgi:hypothetical protein